MWIYYDPETLELKAISTHANVMDRPCVETDLETGLWSNLEVVIEDDKPLVKYKKLQFTDEEWKAITTP